MSKQRPVLIVGGGLTGLSTAAFLAGYDVRALLVERQPWEPSPTGSDGAELRFHTELRWLDQGPDGVTAVLLNRRTGTEYTEYADYLVAADGQHGSIREQLGIRRRGCGLTAAIAERFRCGRVFLAGDAATTIQAADRPSTATADSYDLAWKLAAVLHGAAGPDLLTSYDEERRPQAELLAERAARDYAARAAGGPVLPPPGDTEPEYRSGAVLAEQADVAPSGRPGARLPRVTLRRNGVELSTMDMLTGRWALFTGPAGGLWHSAGRSVADRLGLPLDTFGLGPDLLDPADELPTLFGIGEAGANLVRPDGVVAWRCDYEPDDPASALDTVLRRLLAR